MSDRFAEWPSKYDYWQVQLGAAAEGLEYDIVEVERRDDPPQIRGRIRGEHTRGDRMDVLLTLEEIGFSVLSASFEGWIIIDADAAPLPYPFIGTWQEWVGEDRGREVVA